MKQTKQYDVIIVGGGLAGLTCAIHLSLKNHEVLVLEKHPYPRHKVCGEYVSNEVLPYLQSLGVNPMSEGAKKIEELEISTRTNKKVKTILPLGGFGMSRYCFDELLQSKASESGAIVEIASVENIKFKEGRFKVSTREGVDYQGKFVIGSYGKRSNIDKTLERSFIKKKSPYLGVKMHVRGKFPENKVALHNFKGGYCGVSMVENDAINLCYIADYPSFQQFKNIEDFQLQVLFKNKELKAIFQNSDPLFNAPLTISQISFDTKPLIENHILMCGDAAAMIHPLCGNGMGMAISSAQLLSNLLNDFLEGKIKSRVLLEKMYLSQWNKKFKTRLFFGRMIASVFRNDFATKVLWMLVSFFPFLLPTIIRKTHGQKLKPL